MIPPAEQGADKVREQTAIIRKIVKDESAWSMGDEARGQIRSALNKINKLAAAREAGTRG